MSPRRNEIEVKPVETGEDLRLANDLMAKVHYADYFEALAWLESCGSGFPNYLREHTRIAMRQGQLAGALRLTTDTVRIGEARLKMGGLGWITTAPSHRHHGVARNLIEDALRYMKKNGYHVSMLFGIPNFYHRFGFATALADYAIVVSCAEAVGASHAGFKVRPAKPGDIAAIQKIHSANDVETACSVLRTAARITNQWDRWSKGLRVITTEQGKVVAYLHARKEHDDFIVAEIGIAEGTSGAVERVCRAVLAVAAERAFEESTGRIHFQAPPAHPFARFLTRFVSTHEKHLTHDRGGMMAFADVGETLESMIPEWENLLASSALRDRRTEVTLVLGNASFRVRANCGAVDVSNAPGKNRIGLNTADLLHLVSGYRHPEDTLDARRRILTPEARMLVREIFPKRDVYVWLFDRF